MKLPPLNKSSSLGTGPDLGLGKKGESIESRPEHQLERRIAPHLVGGRMLGAGHGMHARSKAGTLGAPMGSIPSIKGI